MLASAGAMKQNCKLYMDSGKGEMLLSASLRIPRKNSNRKVVSFKTRASAERGTNTHGWHHYLIHQRICS